MRFALSTTLRIVDVLDRGIPHHERVVIAVDRPCNLGKYVLMRGLRSPDGTNVVAIGPVTSFWFPDQQAKRHSVVFVYTDPGRFIETVVSNTSVPTLAALQIPALVYHWGSAETLFNHPDWVPLVLRANRIALPPGVRPTAEP